MTIGEERVRIKFNPSDNTLVSHIKQKSAELIDLCEQHKKLQAVHGQLPVVGNNEVNRLWALAQTHYEDAAMWAVKAATAAAEPSDKIA
jgi:carbamate kinase